MKIAAGNSSMRGLACRMALGVDGVSLVSSGFNPWTVFMKYSSNLVASAGDIANVPRVVFMMKTCFKFFSWQFIAPYSAVEKVP